MKAPAYAKDAPCMVRPGVRVVKVGRVWHVEARVDGAWKPLLCGATRFRGRRTRFWFTRAGAAEAAKAHAHFDMGKPRRTGGAVRCPVCHGAPGAGLPLCRTCSRSLERLGENSIYAIVEWASARAWKFAKKKPRRVEPVTTYRARPA